MAAEIAGKSSETITAPALVDRAAAAYLGFETKVSSPGHLEIRGTIFQTRVKGGCNLCKFHG
jgi:hypothetical protein